jgi:MYXO-CTERM domain-containing protein
LWQQANEAGVTGRGVAHRIGRDADNFPHVQYRVFAFALTLGVLAIPRVATANGQSTHLWITADAISHVPPGPLADFLADPALDRMLRNGTMFPDGGYPLGDPYAEIAHWEPYQTLYLEWILANHQAPFSGEGAEHLAFWLGMASHGMADQTFDALYGERVKLYDGGFGDFDTASDLIMMSYFEPMMAPSDWVPYSVFDQLYDEVGYDVDPATMMDGQNLLRIAVNSVAVLSQIPEQVAESAAPFPWGSQHMLDETVPGAPPCEGEIVARYWRVLWALAHEQALPGPVLGTIPADGAANHASDSSSIESWVSVVASRGLEDAPLDVSSFHVVSEGGTEVPLTIWHYYGQDAHIVHLRPQADLEADTVYTVTVDPGLQTIHGEALEGYEFRFSTGAIGPDPIVPEWPADHDPNPDPGDGDGDGDPGDGDGDPSGDGDGDGDGDPGDGDGDGDATGEGESGTGDPALDQADGCSCSSAASPRHAPALLLPIVVGLTSIVRRRRSRGAADRRARSE